MFYFVNQIMIGKLAASKSEWKDHFFLAHICLEYKNLYEKLQDISKALNDILLKLQF